jgi:TPR repeat protein
MNRSLTSALLAIAALSLAGCDEAPTKTEVAQSPKPAQAEAAKSSDAAVAAHNRKDYATAVALFRSLAAQGYASAQYNLGLMYDNGTGVAQDYKEAVRLYGLAAAQGNAMAQYNLGVMYRNGQGVAQDYVRAHMWYNLGAISGDSKNASTNRDNIAERMTPQQIAEAQAMARKCQASNFKQCD